MPYAEQRKPKPHHPLRDPYYCGECGFHLTAEKNKYRCSRCGWFGNLGYR